MGLETLACFTLSISGDDRQKTQEDDEQETR